MLSSAVGRLHGLYSQCQHQGLGADGRVPAEAGQQEELHYSGCGEEDDYKEWIKTLIWMMKL